MKNLSLITALLLLFAACNNSGTNKKKLKEEIKEGSSTPCMDFGTHCLQKL